MSGVAKALTRTNGPVRLKGISRDRHLSFCSVFEGAAIGMATCSLDGKIVESNAALAKTLGYSREELAGIHTKELHPGDFQQTDLHLGEMSRGARASFKQESRYRRKDGSYLWGQLTVSLVRDAGGAPASAIAILEDATEHKRATEKSREAEKMEVIGRLAGGIAHDFNNLLTGVLLYCDLLATGLRRSARLRKHVDEIRMAGEQGAALIQQLLVIARKQVPERRPILLNEVVASTENLLRRLIGEQIELVLALSPKLPHVLADPTQLRQVLLNLVLNGRDAMPDGGKLTLRTQASHRLSGKHTRVALIVEDTGCGMDAGVRARLFEPFFTTKPVGHGTGLGLATVQRVVSESGGTIEVTSEPGHGTRFEVLFPATEHAASATAPAARSRARETILLVDDHASARSSMQRTLHQAGYRVLQAANGKSALKVFAANPNTVDLLIADWMMPGMNGCELAEKLRHQKADLKILLISGYHDTAEVPSKATPVGLIRKPFTGPVLIERIREALHSKGDSPW